jgi:hypothetical protein
MPWRGLTNDHVSWLNSQPKKPLTVVHLVVCGGYGKFARKMSNLSGRLQARHLTKFVPYGHIHPQVSFVLIVRVIYPAILL